MTEWVFDVANMIPYGEFGEKLVIAKVDRLTGTASVIRTPMLDSFPAGGSVPIDDHVFMRSYYSTAFGTNEIDAFLQAAMECGWKRGLRPKSFDPWAGELAAVNRHLDDMRRVAMQTAMKKVVLPAAVHEQLATASDIGTDTDKSW